jgi:hypothetical protein
MTTMVLADGSQRRRPISFDRRELRALLSLYSQRVASGEWRDYAIDFRPGMAIFSIFRHTAEQPLFAIAKVVPNMARGGRYLVYRGPHRVAHGDDLGELLQVFDRRLRAC